MQHKTREIIYQRLYVRKFKKKMESGFPCYRQLWILTLPFSCSLKFGVNFTLILTPKSAFKPSRQPRRIFSSIGISLHKTIVKLICTIHIIWYIFEYTNARKDIKTVVPYHAENIDKKYQISKVLCKQIS